MAYGTTVSIAGAAPSLPAYGTPVNIVDPVTGAAIVPISNPFVAPNSNVAAVSGIVFTTGNALTANNHGGDYILNLGAGVGTGRNGEFQVNSTWSSGGYTDGDIQQATWTQTVNLNAPTNSNFHGLVSNMVLNGSGANWTNAIGATNAGYFTCTNNTSGVFNLGSPQALAANHIWLGTGTMATCQAAEFYISHQSNGTITFAVGVVSTSQTNAMGGSGVWTQWNAYDINQNGTGKISTIVGYHWSAAQLQNSGAGTDTAGGYTTYGIQGAVPNQGGNTSGTNKMYGAYIGGPSGSPGVGGSYEAYHVYLDSNTARAQISHALHIQAQGAAATAVAGDVYALAFLQMANGGGQATGAITNYGLVVNANAAAGGSPGAGGNGSVNNIAFRSWVPSAIAPAGTTNNNYGVRISGNVANTGTTAAWALFSDSTSNSAFAGSLAVGSTTAAVGTGAIAIEGLIPRYNAVATAGWGVPAIYAAGRPAQQVNATVTLATYVVGAADGSFEVSANINVTVSTTVAMTVTCTYTDEANVARTLQLQFSLLGGTWASSITTAQGNIPYESPVYHLRCKAATTISIQTAGTVTAVTYTGEAIIKQTR